MVELGTYLRRAVTSAAHLRDLCAAHYGDNPDLSFRHSWRTSVVAQLTIGAKFPVCVASSTTGLCLGVRWMQPRFSSTGGWLDSAPLMHVQSCGPHSCYAQTAGALRS